ncbi:solute carrier family 49 member 4 homolog [Haliotis rufescens]|uniref:solute carrier family 49 member 4 homolog n=1 Tax=Haliotis rufescens TaxID=6454 RepID=UPI00201EBE6C|nr:solute carrier family 49 member 4 homolog [Haliotis rufescens]
MDEKTRLLSNTTGSLSDGSGEKEAPPDRVYTPQYLSINAADPKLRGSDDSWVDLASDSTRIATPTFDDSLLAPVNSHPKSPPVAQEVEVKVKLYKRRWYILVIFSLFAATENFVWNTFGPISAASEDAFGWDDGTISTLTNWGPISFMVAAVFFSWVIDVKGIRPAVVTSMMLITAGCGIRCISSAPPLVTWINHIGAALNGLAGPVAMFGNPVLSSIWFGPHERTTSTALTIVITNLGLALSFVIGPMVVPDRTNPNCTNVRDNQSIHITAYTSQLVETDCSLYFNTSGTRIAEERKDIMFLQYSVCGWSVFLFLVILLYFPSRPPLPPCFSASQKRENFLVGLKTLFRRGQFWLLTLIYGLTLGVADCWTGLVDVILKPYGVSEKEAGWMGFYGNVGQMGLSLIVARFADKFSRHFKLLIFILYLLGAGNVACFALVCVGVLPSSLVVLYVTFISATTILFCAEPLIYELTCELTFPIGEGTTNSILTLVNNIFGFVFLLIPTLPNIGSQSWMNWAMLGSIVVSIPPIVLLKDKYLRLEVDEHAETKVTRQQ